jgi:acetyltransferase EpsM
VREATAAPPRGRRLVIVGAGGHAKVSCAVAEAAGFDVVCFLDDDRAAWGGERLGYPVVGPVVRLADYAREGCQGFLGIGSNAVRKRLDLAFAEVEWATLVHPTAWLHHTAALGPGTLVCAFALMHPDSRTGRHTIVNSAALVEHDVVLEDYAHVGPGAVMNGITRAAEGAFVGAGSTVIQCLTVGPWSTLGAGGLASRDVPGRAVATGVPARVKREVGE